MPEGSLYSPQRTVNFSVDRSGACGHSVDVFMESLQQISEELLRILLVVSGKSWSKSLYCPLQTGGINNATIHFPESLDYSGKS